MHFLKVPIAKKLSCLLAFLFLQGLFLPTLAFSQELRGAALSDATANYLKRAGFSAQKAPLSSALFTDFPYNITVDFPAKENDGRAFFLMAAQEDAYENQKFILDLLDWLGAAALPFDLKVVLTAGDRPKILGNEKMAGSEVFCKSVEGMQNAAALILSFDARGKAQVVPGSNGKVSPYYFCRLLCDSMEKNSCPYAISGGIFLSLYRTKLLKNDLILSSFMDREIPAVTLRLCDQEQSRQLSSVKDFFSGIDVQKSAEWSQHYIPIKFFSKRYWIEESAVIYSVMVFIAAAMFALADFAFIFRRRTKRLVVIKRRALRSNYLIFVTAIIVALSFHLGQGVALLFQSIGVRNPMVLFVIKLAPAFFIISMVYPLELGRHSRLTTYNYEYILSISAILNIFIFSLFEITLFYLFAIECLLLVLSRAFKSRFSLFIFLTVFITPYLPLLYSILIFSDGPRIYKLIFCGFSQNLLLAFLLVPFNLLWLRILARLNIKAKDKRQKILGFFVTSASCFAGLALFSTLVIFTLNKIFFANVEMPRPKARVFYSKQILRTVAQVYDTEYYGGKIRRIEISSLEDAERLSITVNGKGSNPVYFSVYDTISTDKTAEFLLPDNPPKKLNIIYTPGASSEQDIVINAYYMDHESGGQNCFCETLVFEAEGDEINLRKDGDGI
ncbi:MAG: hypothetical protein J6V90_01695 [Treponema sp.]|nr:hypothetical protein [Treponema sp.]